MLYIYSIEGETSAIKKVLFLNFSHTLLALCWAVPQHCTISGFILTKVMSLSGDRTKLTQIKVFHITLLTS